jgi:hypothetical protein
VSEIKMDWILYLPKRKMNPPPLYKSYKTITIMNFNAIGNPIYPLTGSLEQGMFMLDQFNSRLTLDVNYETKKIQCLQQTSKGGNDRIMNLHQFCMNVITCTDFEID